MVVFRGANGGNEITFCAFARGGGGGLEVLLKGLRLELVLSFGYDMLELTKGRAGLAGVSDGGLGSLDSESEEVPTTEMLFCGSRQDHSLIEARAFLGSKASPLSFNAAESSFVMRCEGDWGVTGSEEHADSLSSSSSVYAPGDSSPAQITSCVDLLELDRDGLLFLVPASETWRYFNESCASS